MLEKSQKQMCVYIYIIYIYHIYIYISYIYIYIIYIYISYIYIYIIYIYIYIIYIYIYIYIYNIYMISPIRQLPRWWMRELPHTEVSCEYRKKHPWTNREWHFGKVQYLLRQPAWVTMKP